MTVPEAAAYLRTPIATLRYWRHVGSGPHGFRVGRWVVFRRVDLDQWLTQQLHAQARRR